MSSFVRILALLLFLFAGAGCGQKQPVLPLDPAPGERTQILRQDEQGVVALALTPHFLSDAAPPGGVRRALAQASGAAACSAAIFLYTERDQAEQWVLSECDLRRRRGMVPRVVLAGHSLGATEACELARRLLAGTDDTVIQLLVTVDAIKTGTMGATSGMSATVLTLANPLPGRDFYFIAYDGSPAVDGQRLLAHANYYQVQTKLYHGGPMSRASENRLISADEMSAVNHGNVDDCAYPLVLADLRAAIRAGAGQ